METITRTYREETMIIDDMLSLIPADWEYSFTVQKRGYRYFGYLKVFNRKKAIKLNGSSNDLSTVVRSMTEKLRRQTFDPLKVL